MNFNKILWGIRAIIYKIKLGSIGLPSYFGKPLYIEKFSNLYCGKRVRIYPGLRFESVEKGKLNIGSNVSIGQNVHLVSYKEILNVGDNVTISGNVLITNCDHSYTDIEKSVLEQELIFKDTRIGDGCFIGYGAIIQAGTILGKHCIVGANSVVRGIFPDYSVIVGSPAKIIKKFNIEKQIWEKVK